MKSRIILFKRVELDRIELNNQKQRNARDSFNITELKSLRFKKLTDRL